MIRPSSPSWGPTSPVTPGGHRRAAGGDQPDRSTRLRDRPEPRFRSSRPAPTRRTPVSRSSPARRGGQDRDGARAGHGSAVAGGPARHRGVPAPGDGRSSGSAAPLKQSTSRPQPQTAAHRAAAADGRSRGSPRRRFRCGWPTTPRWIALRSGVEQAERKSELRRAEDPVDAVVCAYVALFATRRPGAITVYGDFATGYIVTLTLPADLTPAPPEPTPGGRGRGGPLRRPAARPDRHHRALSGAGDPPARRRRHQLPQRHRPHQERGLVRPRPTAACTAVGSTPTRRRRSPTRSACASSPTCGRT